MTEDIAGIIRVMFAVGVLIAAIAVFNKEHERRWIEHERRWIERVCIGGPM